MAKRYARINWENKPSIKTPANATNLNKMDKAIDDLDNAIEDIYNEQLPLKVDAVEGKGLSTNDYTDGDKGKVNNLPNDTSQALSQMSNSLDYLSQNQLSIIDDVNAIGNVLPNKVDKVDGKGLSSNDYTTTDKNKVAKLPDDTLSHLAAIVSQVDLSVIDTKTGTFIQSTVADDKEVELRIEGATLVTKANPSLDISPDNVAMITNASNFDVVATGVNIINMDNMTKSTVTGVTYTKNTDGSITVVNNSGGAISNDIILTGKISFGTYTIKNYSTNDLYVQLVAGDYSLRVIPGASLTFNYTVANSILRLLYANFNNGTTHNLKLQLERGSTATTYEPFKGSNKINIPYELAKLQNGVADTSESFSTNKTKRTQRIRKYVLSSGAWSILYPTAHINTAFFQLALPDSVFDSTVRCTHFNNYTATYLWGIDLSGVAINNSGRLQISIPKASLIGWNDSLTDIQKVNLFVNWISQNPVTVYYELATPIETIIDLPLKLTTYQGITNVYTTATVQPTIIGKFLSRLRNSVDTLRLQLASKTIEDWITPTLQNGWVNFDITTHETVGYQKDSMGYVHLKGIVKNGTSTSIVFTLPSGYRPKLLQRFPISVNSTTIGMVEFSSSGAVVIYTSSVAGTNSLNGITFKAEA